MLAQYGYIAIFLVIALTIPVGALTFSFLLRPKSTSNLVKNDTYECGLETIGSSWVQFNTRYYLYAIAFVVFDVETIFLYPWAVSYNKLAVYGLVEMLIFVGILAVGLLYVWKKKALEWR